AAPQIGIFIWRWRTMWSPKIAGSFTSARPNAAGMTNTSAQRKRKFMDGIVPSPLERIALVAHVAVENDVIVDVDLAVGVEIAVEPAAQGRCDALVDVGVVVDVQLSVEVGVAAVGEFDADRAGVDGDVFEDRGVGVGNAECLLGFSDAEHREGSNT